LKNNNIYGKIYTVNTSLKETVTSNSKTRIHNKTIFIKPGVIMNLKIENISKKYGKKTILKDISFAAMPGECIGILGENGCGKTTLLSILAGINKPDDGRFLIDVDNVHDNNGNINDNTTNSINLIVRKNLIPEYIGWVPQGTPFMEDLSVRDNLKLWYTGSYSNLTDELDKGILKLLGIDEFIDKRVSTLSGGMKKRLSIGCAMANKPRILILDEAGAGLDLTCKNFILNYLDKFKKSGGIIILTSHEEPEIKFCDRLYILKDGVLNEHHYTTTDNLIASM